MLCLKCLHFFKNIKLLNWGCHQDEVFGHQMIECLERKPNYSDLYLIHFPISLDYVPIDQKYPPEWLNLN